VKILSKNLTDFDILGGLGGMGYKMFPCMNPRRLSHLESKLVGGSDLQVGSGKK